MIKKKLTRLWNVLVEFWNLYSTLATEKIESGKPVIKTFGKPSFSGGPLTKLRQMDVISAKRAGKYNTLYCSSGIYVPLFLVKALKARGAKLIVNQNGVGYPAWNPKGYKEQNKWLKALNQISDHTFFQSEFALKSYTDWVGEVPSHFSILHNSVDLQQFKPREKTSEQNPWRIRLLVFSDVSPFSKKLWKYVLDLVQFCTDAPKKLQNKTASVFPSLEWVFLGRVLNSATYEELGFSSLAENKKVQFLFNTSDFKIPEVLSSCDVALHLVHNDVCPNKVLECMASGLYIIAGSTGGTPELVGNAGKILPVDPSYDAPQYPKPEDVYYALLSYIQNRQEFSQITRKRAENFDINRWYRVVHEKALALKN